MVLTLPDWLTGMVFVGLMVFVRVGAAFLALPGLGSVAVPTLFRLLLALAFAMTLAPVMGDRLPGLPPDPVQLVMLIFHEALVGLFIGTLAKLLILTVETAGVVVAQQLGLANAFLFDPQQSAQTSLPSAVLGQIALVILFVTDLHHMLLRALADSYTVFPPDSPLMPGDMADVMARTVGDGFALGVQMASPFLVVMVLFFAGLGLINRLMQQIQVFFIATPVQTLLGMFLFALVFGAMIRTWVGYFDAGMARFLVVR